MLCVKRHMKNHDIITSPAAVGSRAGPSQAYALASVLKYYMAATILHVLL